MGKGNRLSEFIRIHPLLASAPKTLTERRSALFIWKSSFIILACLAVSLARVQGGEKTFSHHAFPTASKLCHPLEVLTGRETEFYLNVMKELKSVIAEALEAVTGCFYEIIYIALMNLGVVRGRPRFSRFPADLARRLNRST